MPLASNNFLELKDCVFIRGFPTNVNFTTSEIRKYFNDRVGKCCVEMTAQSKDKGRLFVVLKFDSPAAAANAIERFSGKQVLNHKVRLDFWRAPLSMIRPERSGRDSYDKHNRRWDNNTRFDRESEESLRLNDNLTREKNSCNTNYLPRKSVAYDDQEEFKEESDNFRGFQQHTYMETYETNVDFKNYQEKNEQYSQDGWNSDGGGEGQYPGLDYNWNEWDPNLRGSHENLSDRGYYEREQEFFYPRCDKFWQECEADQGRRPVPVDEDFTKDYDANFSQWGNYFEFSDDRHAHNERLSPEKSGDQTSHRGDRFCSRGDREWFANREFTEETRRRFPPSDETVHWPRWETIPPSNQTRKPSNLDVTKDTLKHVARSHDLRSSTPTEGRPRSDEWLRNIHRDFRGRDRHSASPVNVRSKTFCHLGSPLAGNTSSKTTGDSAHSRRGRSSLSPVRDILSGNGSSSVDKGFAYKTRESSPMNGRSGQFNEQSFGRKLRGSRSFSPNLNTRTSWPRGRGNDSKDRDLRRSLMMHQHGKHSSLRDRDRDRERENSLKHSLRGTRISPEKHRSEASSSGQVPNRKRRREDDGRRDDKTKRRRQTSVGMCDNASSAPENGNYDSTRKRGRKETDEKKKLSPRDHERKRRQQRDPTASNSNTRRTDRFLSKLAVTLAQGKVPTKRPETKLDASKKNASTNGNSGLVKCTGSKAELSVNTASKSAGSRPGEKRNTEREEATPPSGEEKQSSNSDEDISCAEGEVEGDHAESIIGAEVSSCNDLLDQEEEEEKTDGNESSNLSEDDSEHAGSYENSISYEDDFLNVDEDSSSVVDDGIDDERLEISDIDRDGTGECDECSNFSTGNSENGDQFENTGNGLRTGNLSSDEEFSKLNMAGDKDMMEVDNIELRDSQSSETWKKIDYNATLLEEGNKTCHVDQQTNLDESFGEPNLKQEIDEYKGNVVHEKTASTTTHRAHGEISAVNGKLPEWEGDEESCHLNVISDMGCNTIPDELSKEVSSRAKVLKMLPDNVLTHDEDEADGSVWQREEHDAMFQSKDNYQVADKESVSDDISRDPNSTTKTSCSPVPSSSTENDGRRGDNFNLQLGSSLGGYSDDQFMYSRSSPKVLRTKTSISYLEASSGPLNQRGYYEDKSNYNRSENPACNTECQDVLGSVRDSKEGQGELKNDNRKDSHKADNEDERDHRNIGLDYWRNDVNNKTTHILPAFHKREDIVTYATCKDKFLCKQGEVYIPVEAQIAQKDGCHHNEDGLVHNLNVNDVREPEVSTSDREQGVSKEETSRKSVLEGDGDILKDNLGREYAICNVETSNDINTKVGIRDLSNSSEETNLESLRLSGEVVPSAKDTISSRTADLQSVDMDISLDGDFQDFSKGLSVCVDNDTTLAEDGGGNRPYSPSSPTWTSEEHRSPLPKDEILPYSPRDPIRVSGSDAPRSIVVEDFSNEDSKYDDIEPIFDSMDVGCDLPEEEDVTINSGSTKEPFTSSSIFNSSPKSESEVVQGKSILDDITEEKVLRGPMITNSETETRNVKDKDLNCDEEGRGKDGEVLSDNPVTENITKDDLRYLKFQDGTDNLVPLASVDVKPEMEYVTASKVHKAGNIEVFLDNSVKEKSHNDGRNSLRCHERTQCLTTCASMDVIPKKAFVTSTKTYLLYADSGTQHKPHILYATNDTNAGRARSLSLDSAWSLAKYSIPGPSKATSNSEEEQQETAGKKADVVLRAEEKNPDNVVEPLLSSGPCSCGSPLKVNGDTSENGDQVSQGRGLLKGLRSDNMAVVQVPGPGDWADSRVMGSANTALNTSLPNSDDIITAPSADPGHKELLPLQTPLQQIEKEAPVEDHGRKPPGLLSYDEVSLNIQAPCGTNEKDFLTNLANSDIRNNNFRPDETSVTSFLTDNMPVACVSDICAARHDDRMMPPLGCSDKVQSTNSEMQDNNENDFESNGGIQRQASVSQNGDNTSHSTPANTKRPCPDSKDESFRTNKVARKALKLIMPTDRIPNRHGKTNPNSACSLRDSKKTSSRTITSADMDIVTEESHTNVVLGDSLFTNKPNHLGEDVYAENVSSCGDISIKNGHSHTFKNDRFTCALKTGSLPPLSNTKIHSQSRSIVGDINVNDNTAKRILPDVETSCRRRESDWVALKMEKLRKKKEEIEQVYKQECQTVINVVNMLVSNDPRLEGLLQNAVRRTLQEMGRRCVQELEKQALPGT